MDVELQLPSPAAAAGSRMTMRKGEVAVDEAIIVCVLLLLPGPCLVYNK